MLCTRTIILHHANMCVCVKHPYFNSVVHAHVFSFVSRWCQNRRDLRARYGVAQASAAFSCPETAIFTFQMAPRAGTLTSRPHTIFSPMFGRAGNSLREKVARAGSLKTPCSLRSLVTTDSKASYTFRTCGRGFQQGLPKGLTPGEHYNSGALVENPSQTWLTSTVLFSAILVKRSVSGFFGRRVF